MLPSTRADASPQGSRTRIRLRSRSRHRTTAWWCRAVCLAGAALLGATYWLASHLVVTRVERLPALQQLPQPVSLVTLRHTGEKVAERWPGLPVGGEGGQPGWRGLRPLDSERVADSCRSQPGGKVVLVTGAAGFIGMQAAMSLHARGDGVLGLDNFNSYYPVSLKRARQAALEAEGVYVVDGDLNDTHLLRKLWVLCRFTHVLHLAAQAGVRYATHNAHAYVASNVAGLVSLLEVMKAQVPMPALVYASSSSVYGLTSKRVFSERDRADRPASLYAATKKAGELLTHTYCHIYGLSATGLRFFTVYGPWGRPDMAAYKFAVAIMKGEPIPIFQGPNGTELSRDFTYIDDVVAGVLGALDTAAASGLAVPPRTRYRIYNLGNTHPAGVSALVAGLEAALGRPARRRYLPLPAAGDLLATYADISAAAADLGYRPQVPLADGLARFARWFFDYYGAQVISGSEQPTDWAYKPLR